jgi:hypothetical protein
VGSACGRRGSYCMSPTDKIAFAIWLFLLGVFFLGEGVYTFFDWAKRR